MLRDERSHLRARLAELQQTLQRTRSDDLRETLLEAIAECERRLAELEAKTGQPAPAHG